MKCYSTPAAERQQASDEQAEIRRLRAELRRVTDERDILKKAAAYFAKLSG
jgi:transposase